MPHHHERRALPYSAGQMYDLVVDVRRYREFLPWVAAVRIRAETEHETLADLVVGFKNLRETFSSRVLKTPKSQSKPKRVSMLVATSHETGSGIPLKMACSWPAMLVAVRV